MKNKKINENSLAEMFFGDNEDEFGRKLYKNKFDGVEHDFDDEDNRGDYADADAEFSQEKEDSIILKMKDHMLHHAVHGTKPEDWDTLDLVDDIFNELTESEIDYVEDNEELLNNMKNSAVHEANKELIGKMQKESLVKEEEEGNVDKEDNTPFTEDKKNYHHTETYFEPGAVTYDEKEDVWYDPNDEDNKKSLTEKAPPGKKYEDMVLAMKAKGTPKNIAYATAWKRYNEENPSKESKEYVTEASIRELLLGKDEKKEADHDPKIQPWSNTVDAMTEFGDINNPHAMAWQIFNKHNKGQKALIKKVIKITRKDNKDR